MEAAAAATSLTIPGRRWHLPSPSLSPSHSLSVPSIFPTPFIRLSNHTAAATGRLPHLNARKERRWSSRLGASASDNPPLESSERWLLEPAGDGDSRHIGFKVPLPGAFEIVSDVVTVGRVPEKATLVIPVATVSGAHARLEKKNGSLLVTDLDSTNGTYIGEQRLEPGAAATVSPGSYLTFGDVHLAMFRVSKLVDDFPGEAIDPQIDDAETDFADSDD